MPARANSTHAGGLSQLKGSSLSGSAQGASATSPTSPCACCRPAAVRVEWVAHAPQVRLDLDLAAQLVLNASLAQLALVEHLQGDNKVRLLLTRQVDLAEFAVAERLANVKVVERPCPRLLARIALRTSQQARSRLNKSDICCDRARHAVLSAAFCNGASACCAWRGGVAQCLTAGPRRQDPGPGRSERRAGSAHLRALRPPSGVAAVACESAHRRLLRAVLLAGLG